MEIVSKYEPDPELVAKRAIGKEGFTRFQTMRKMMIMMIMMMMVMVMMIRVMMMMMMMITICLFRPSNGGSQARGAVATLWDP